jgi:hypothetical protein
MKLILLALFPLIAANAFAATLNFECKTTQVIEGKSATLVAFTIENIGDVKTITYGGDDEPVRMTPLDSVLDLNDNWQVIQNLNKDKSPKSITLTSDGDGCQFTTMVLYAEKGYKAGFVSVKGKAAGCGQGDYYSPVSCSAE